MNSLTKAAPMTKDETKLLLQLVAVNEIINNKTTNAINNELKKKAWQNLANDFNSSIATVPRTAAQLRLKWENLKKSARKHCANTRNGLIKTGRDEDCFPPDGILDKVASLLGITRQGRRNTSSNLLLQCNRLPAAKRKHKMQEELCKARIYRDNALAEYLKAKKKKLDLENNEKEILIAKLKLEIENARLENLILRGDSK
ncbi:uncharacterized protein LOC101746975 isoform X1 [Bombyx mori]|uniref:Regulatory protein zeste n=2 Tax=Bombyx mori TaxID=7091 RepID=A0A8R1WF78_BOMMO|nr:uncharacterized protein LOC101746975 isoform X1 [Bombyx mori]